jgi:RHS repeat-associated protein
MLDDSCHIGWGIFLKELSPLAFGVGMDQATDYYPYGKSFDSMNVSKNPYLYNGKELQAQVMAGTHFDWYNHGARFYDPVLGLWHSVDPLLEDMHYETSYGFCGGNPVSAVDMDGCKYDYDYWNRPNYYTPNYYQPSYHWQAPGFTSSYWDIGYNPSSQFAFYKFSPPNFNVKNQGGTSISFYQAFDKGMKEWSNGFRKLL